MNKEDSLASCLIRCPSFVGEEAFLEEWIVIVLIDLLLAATSKAQIVWPQHTSTYPTKNHPLSRIFQDDSIKTSFPHTEPSTNLFIAQTSTASANNHQIMSLFWLSQSNQLNPLEVSSWRHGKVRVRLCQPNNVWFAFVLPDPRRKPRYSSTSSQPFLPSYNAT